MALLDEKRAQGMAARIVPAHQPAGARYLGETSLRCRGGQVRARLIMLRDGGRNMIVLSAPGEAKKPRPADMLSSDDVTELVHEMRAPLTIIRSAATLMRERPEAVGAISAGHRAQLRTAAEHGERHNDARQ